MSRLPGNYQALSADEKRELLWQRIAQDPYSEDQLPTRAPGPFARRKIFKVAHNRGSFEHVSDEMPAGRKSWYTRLARWLRYGILRLAEQYVASRYGDEQLFFQHHVGPTA